MRVWKNGIPVKEGWYFWRLVRETDPWKYQVIFVMENDPKEGDTSYWEGGVCIKPSNGGVWSNRIPS